MGLAKRKLVFQPSIFRCYVSFRECIHIDPALGFIEHHRSLHSIQEGYYCIHRTLPPFNMMYFYEMNSIGTRSIGETTRWKKGTAGGDQFMEKLNMDKHLSTNIQHPLPRQLFKMIFLFLRWDLLVAMMVKHQFFNSKESSSDGRTCPNGWSFWWWFDADPFFVNGYFFWGGIFAGYIREI